MRLEPLCELFLALTTPLEHAKRDGLDGIMYTTGDGRASGCRLQGTVRWTNHPRIRADGTTLPDLHGVITTDDEEILLIELRGISVTIGHGPGRDTRASIMFTASGERYTWLNNAFCVCEGTFDSVSGSVRFHVFECINEGA